MKITKGTWKLMGDDRPSAYYEGDVLIIRASAIGTSCLWELVASAQGYEPTPVPENLQHAFDEGHRLEPVINDMLRDNGYMITGEQAEGELVISPTLKIRYHPDGFITGGPKGNIHTRILEDKTMADSSWQRAARGSVGDIFPEYNWQISVMMWAQVPVPAHGGYPDPNRLFMPALWVAYNKGNSDGSPCPDQGRLLYQTLDLPPIALHEIITKAQTIQALVEGEDILVSGRPCDDPSHYPCRFLHLRPEVEGASVTIDGEDTVVIPEDEQEAIDLLIMQYVRYKGAMEEAKEKVDQAKEALIERAGGASRILTDKWIVPVVDGTNVSPDWASMPQAVREEAQEYKKRTKYKYLKNIQRRG